MHLALSKGSDKSCIRKPTDQNEFNLKLLKIIIPWKSFLKDYCHHTKQNRVVSQKWFEKLRTRATKISRRGSQIWKNLHNLLVLFRWLRASKYLIDHSKSLSLSLWWSTQVATVCSMEGLPSRIRLKFWLCFYVCALEQGPSPLWASVTCFVKKGINQHSP